MGNNHYDYFYFKTEEKIVKLDNLIDDIKSRKNYAEVYRGKMFCPVCRIAPLAFVSTEGSEHLRSNSLNAHDENCKYRFGCATKKIIIEYLDSLTNEQLKRELESKIRSLKKNIKNKSTNVNETVNLDDLPNLIVKKLDNGTKEVNSIREKSFNVVFTSEIEGIYLFYGEVKLKVEEQKRKKDGKKFYVVSIITKNTNGIWEKKASIIRKNYKDLVVEDKIYYIAVFGELKVNGKYSNIEIRKNNQLMIIDKETDRQIGYEYVDFDKPNSHKDKGESQDIDKENVAEKVEDSVNILENKIVIRPSSSLTNAEEKKVDKIQVETVKSNIMEVFNYENIKAEEVEDKDKELGNSLSYMQKFKEAVSSTFKGIFGKR